MRLLEDRCPPLNIPPPTGERCATGSEILVAAMPLSRYMSLTWPHQQRPPARSRTGDIEDLIYSSHHAHSLSTYKCIAARNALFQNHFREDLGGDFHRNPESEWRPPCGSVARCRTRRMPMVAGETLVSSSLASLPSYSYYGSCLFSLSSTR